MNNENTACWNRIHRIRLAVGILVLSSCAADGPAATDVGLKADRLELECATASPDVAGDVFEFLPSTDPLDPARPQPYGSPSCTGVVFEFDNPAEEALRGAWIQASGESETSSDVFSEGRCSERVLEADFWGYENREWTRLASASVVGRFEEDVEASAYCRVEAVIEQAVAFKKLRIAARVSQGSETYPMQANLW